MAAPRSIRRPLLSLSLPLLVLAGLGLRASGDHHADVAAGSPTAASADASGDAVTGSGDGAGRGRPSAGPSSTTTAAPTTTALPTTVPPVTAPPTTAPPTTSAPAAPVTERAPEPGPEPEPAPPPAPPAPPAEPAPAPQQVTSVSPAPPPAFVPAPAGDIDTIVAHHNARRAEAGLPSLSYNGCLAGLAASWADHLASILGLLHQVGLGGLVGSCIDWRSAGENVGYSSLGAADVASGFFDSPPHRANILDPDFTEIGVGIAYADGRAFVTVMFGG